MADIEDDAEFGSHFLDSMLEVQMTEEDNELDVLKNCDPLDTLPPIPTFDLQSETLNYKEVFNAFPQPVLATLPVAAPTPTTVPLVIKPSSMLIYSGEVPTQSPVPVLSTVQTVTTKPVAKPATKSVKVAANVNSIPESQETNDKRFLKDVFLPEFVKNVFVKADPPCDIAHVSKEEMKYYNTCFKDASKVQICRLHCTICDKHLGCADTAQKKINVHSMLRVLTCKPCFEFYGDGNFPCDKGDNCEIYCRWCGQGGALVCCSFCPRVFCKKCVKRNFGPLFLRKLEKATDWACFCCAQKPLWPHRAICRALLEFLEKKKNDPKVPLRDTTSCCSVAGLTRKRLRLAIDKNKTTVPESPIKFNPPLRTPNAKNKTYPSPKTVMNDQLTLKPVVQMKSSDRVKIPLTANRNSEPKPKTITNIFSPRSIISGNSVIRGITTSTPTKLFSAFPTPQLIQSPVVHREPLIGSSPRILVQANPPGNSALNSSCVRVSLTHQAPSLDVNKIPTVKVPQMVQGLFLRLLLPDNKMQYVRLVFDGICSQPSRDFPMPQFKEKEMSFVEENLAEAFKISKMMYEKLMRIKEKVNSRTKLTEKSVFNSSVKKLHVDYENIIELYKELDRTLLENQEEWKKEAKNPVDVIDLSDDESLTAKRHKPNRYSNARETRKNNNEDSDIEILDDVTVNGKTSNGNFKDKYRLRSSSEQAKAHLNDNVVVERRKRKRGRVRNADKRLKTTKMLNGQPEEDPLMLEEAEAGKESSPVKNDADDVRKGNLGEKPPPRGPKIEPRG